MTRAYNLTEHFSWHEVEYSATAWRLGILNTVPAELETAILETGRQMEEVRSLFGRPIKVNSWYRCRQVNEAIGGSKNSAHMRGRAVDFEVPGILNHRAFHALAISDTPFDQLIHERTKSGADWIHIGFADWNVLPRRQVLRAEGNALGGKMTFTRVAVG